MCRHPCGIPHPHPAPPEAAASSHPLGETALQPDLCDILTAHARSAAESATALGRLAARGPDVKQSDISVHCVELTFG